MPIAYLGLGSNLGEREENLTQALGLLSQKVEIKRISSLYETEPVGYKEQPSFLNLVCQVSTDLNPEELLHLAKIIEARLGRIPSFPNAARPIDIDILFYDNQIIKSRNLVIPHPRLAERTFVLIPLVEIAPDLIHPEIGKTIHELASGLKEQSKVGKWTGGLNVPTICGGAL